MAEEIKQSADGTLEQGEFKSKKKRGRPRKLTQKDNTTKVDMSVKKEDNAVQESETTKPVLQSNEQAEEKREEVTVELQEVGQPHGESEKPTEEVKEEKEVVVINETVKEPAIEEEQLDNTEQLPSNLPGNVNKLVEFMNETGGSLEDYVVLNKDYDGYDDSLLIKEYYKKTKPHLDTEEINFLMEDNFSFDEEVDETRFVRKQKLAYKEEAAKARNFLKQLKSKYYDEIKLRPSVTNEQKKAMDFFDRYNRTQKQTAVIRDKFLNTTKDYFQNEFEGFNFDVGDKRFKYKVSNPQDIAESQSDISKFIGKYTDDSGAVSDLNGYHKALYAARNADRIAEHFYEQGKADATRDIVNKSKNVDVKPRGADNGEPIVGGFKVRAITDGDGGKRLKIKRRT